MSSPEKIQELIDSSTTIVFLTGAGVSTDSGIPDFKTLDSNWDFPVSRIEATSARYFNRNPKSFWEAFRYLFELKTDVKPNPFHEAVAALENKGKEVTVLTQNIDGLHIAAGSSKVVELHGNLRDVICNRTSCGYRETMTLEHNEDSHCPKCRKALRPDVVLFGESPRGMREAKDKSTRFDLLIVAGTDLAVGPVNGLPIRRMGYYVKPTIWVNKAIAPVEYSYNEEYSFTESFIGSVVDFAELLK